uniref:Uncharacterized protein n=1 Tax=Stomoxys calcitrans TaxID=35570 RepID=A0A1I8NN01_STOCA
MNKCAFIILLLWAFSLCQVYAEILDLGKRPSWYPDDSPEIEAECMEDFTISEESLKQIRNLQIANTPAVRAYLLCFLKETNVYRPDKGPEIKRIAWSLKQNYHLNKCDADMIRDCIEEQGDQDLKDYAFFNIIKCVFHKNRIYGTNKLSPIYL